MAVKDFVLQFGVDIRELVSGMTAASEAVEASALQMKESLEEVSAAFEMIGTAALAITGILAGGKVFGDMISSTVKLNVESKELGKQFGISATDASVLKIALGSVFLTQDQFSAAAARITRTLNTNEGAFKSLGVATRDQSGALRSTIDIMTDVNARLMTFTEGTNRNVEGVKIYGRGWAEVAPILRLTKAAMEEAAVTATELNLQVGQESEAATAAYRSSMEGVHNTIDGIFNAVGQSLLPVLTDLGVWFRSVGPEAIGDVRVAMEGVGTIFSQVGAIIKTLWGVFTDFVSIFRDGIAEMFGGQSLSALEFFVNALRVVEVAFIALRTGVQITVQYISNEFEYLQDLIAGWSAVLDRAFHLDWAGVKAAWKAGNDKIEADEREHFRKLVDLAQKSADDMNAAIMDQMGKPQTQTPTAKPPTETGSSSGLQKQQDEELAAFGKFLDEESALLEKHHAAEMAMYKEEEAEFGKNAQAKIAIAEQEVAAQERVYGKGSAQAIEAQKHLVEVTQQAAEQIDQIAAVYAKNEEARQRESVAMGQKILEEKFQNHEITSKQLEQGEIELQNRLYQIDEAAVAQQLANTDAFHDPLKYAQLCAQIEALEQEHQNKIYQIQQQSVQRDQKLWDQMDKAIQQDFSKSITAMLEGTQTFSQGVKNLEKDLAETFVQLAAKNIATMIEQAVVGKTIRAQEIQGDAAKAASGAYSAIAGIPYVGPFLAPAAAAVAYAAVLAFDTAEGGYDIPSGVNPMTQLHQREMVLPQPIADPLRDALASGVLSGRGGGGGTTIIRANDAKSFARQLKKGGVLEKTMRKMHQRGTRG
jgi:hypothetical protein